MLDVEGNKRDILYSIDARRGAEKGKASVKLKKQK